MSIIPLVDGWQPAVEYNLFDGDGVGFANAIRKLRQWLRDPMAAIVEINIQVAKLPTKLCHSLLLPKTKLPMPLASADRPRKTLALFGKRAAPSLSPRSKTAN